VSVSILCVVSYSSSYGYRPVGVNIVGNTDHIELEHISGEGSMFGDDVQRIAIDIVYVSDWLLRVKVLLLLLLFFFTIKSINMLTA